MKAAFTLVELLVVLATLLVLVAIVVPATSHVSQYAARAKVASNMRQIGVAAHLYANDHNQEFPGQPSELGGGADLWPTLFCNYLSPSDPRVFLDCTSSAASALPLPEIISNVNNNTGYIYNGFDDLAVGGVPPTSVPLLRLGDPTQVVLLAQKQSASKTFFVDPILQPLANLLGALNPTAYDGGAYYLYADGSVRFARQSDYSNTFWLVNKSLTLPVLPLLLQADCLASAP